MVTLIHDITIPLGMYAILGVTHGAEIDSLFVLALLTIMGISMADTIVVFDRVRENTHLMHGASKTEIINRSINDTLSRTIMTSVTVFLTLLILFIFGGEVTRGFAFAMLIGVITGSYSSIFVAAPILVDFAKDKPLGGPESKVKVSKKKVETA